MNNILGITLSTIKSFTLQQVFDAVATHLLKQGEVAQDEFGDCRYRTDSDMYCAVGCLVGDKEYNDRKMEGQVITGAVFDKYFNPFDRTVIAPLDWVEATCKSDPYRNLLKELQAIHDSTISDDWYMALDSLATKLGLNTDALPKA